MRNASCIRHEVMIFGGGGKGLFFKERRDVISSISVEWRRHANQTEKFTNNIFIKIRWSETGNKSIGNSLSNTNKYTKC